MYPSPSYFLDARSANSVGLQCREVARRVWYRLRSSCSPARYWAIRPSPPASAAFGFLLRQGYHYGRSAWTKLYRRWLAGLKFERAVHHIVLEDYIAAVEAAEARRDRLTAQIEAMLPDWTLAGRGGLQTMRGMALVNAATLITELGDLSRFANPPISEHRSIRAVRTATRRVAERNQRAISPARFPSPLSQADTRGRRTAA